VTRSPLFAARRIEVSGASHPSAARVIQLAGVGRGTNVFWLRTSAVQHRLERNPWIASARVSRSLPSTISIVVRERSPVAEVADGAGYRVIASDGTVLGRAVAPGAYPQLLVDPTQRGTVASAARVAGAMSQWLRGRVRSIADTNGDVVVHLASGVPVYYGDSSFAVAKGEAAAAVLRWALAGSKQLVSINVRAPLAPTAQLPYVPPVPIAPPKASKHGKTPKAGASPTPTPSASPTAPWASASPSPRVAAAKTHRRSRHTHSP
jgi:cell division protein FtsQ